MTFPGKMLMRQIKRLCYNPVSLYRVILILSFLLAISVLILMQEPAMSGDRKNIGIHASHYKIAVETVRKTDSDKQVRDEKLETDDNTMKSMSPGYTRAKRVQGRCRNSAHDFSQKKIPFLMLYSTSSGKLSVCPIWKAGTTLIRRFFLMEKEKRYKNITNPYDISFEKGFGRRGYMYNDDSTDTFMFVRNPYSRLVSGYVDKVLAPNPVYWRIIGRPAIKAIRKNPSRMSLSCGHDLTFAEYIKYVIFVMKNRGRHTRRIGNRTRSQIYSPDMHFELMNTLCKPCKVKYNFIGKMENMATDLDELLIKMNLSQTLDLLKTNGKKLAEIDAIKDTASQPFDRKLRQGFGKCIVLIEAFERAWRKLISRGLIGDVPLPLSSENLESLTKSEFLHMALKANQETPKEERLKIGGNAYLDYYRSVSKEDLESLAEIYKDDFTLFEYENRPDYLFKMSR